MARAQTSGLLVLLALSAAASAHAQNHVGINVHVPAPDLLDLCAHAGVTWVRMDGDWLSLNPARGRLEWTALDRSVDAARARNLNVFLTLGYTPEWVPRVPRARADSAPQNDEPATSDEWRAFVTEAVRRYRARGVRHFGMWNEANLESFWESAAGIDAYINKILIPGAAAVRAACPDCVVLGPDLAHVGDYHLPLDRILERARSSIDILTHHTYAGWPETGTTVFSGDNFLQTIEARRFPFTRPALREVLDARGYTGEVWLTETGYRARPPGDAAAEERQAIYVRRALEEQLARRWWTHTFFYEVMDCGVDQVGCDIDGFGLSRPLRPITTGARSFPADYRLKPAFNTLREFIRSHPEVVSRAEPAQCANGRDDDRDGRIDADDRGCTGGLDNNESDDPPRRRVEALAVPSGSIRVDGDLSEWSDAGWTDLDRSAWVGAVPLLVSTDAEARLAARWTREAVYLAVEVTDDRHVNDRSDDTLWVGDSLQIAFDVARNYGARYDNTDDHELTYALARGAPRAQRFHGPAGSNSLGTYAVTRDGTRTRYELALPPAALRPAALARGLTVGFSFLVNDNDGQTTTEGNGREGWLEFTSGIGVRKDPYQFGELLLGADAPSVPRDAGAPPPLDAGAPPPFDAGARSDLPAPTDLAATGDSARVIAEDPPPAGCACRTSRSGARGSAWSLLALALLGARRRRRAALALTLAALALGCADDGVIDPNAPAAFADDQVASLVITAEGAFDGSLSIAPGAASVTQSFRAVATARDGRRGDVSARARWSVGGVVATQALAPQGNFSASAPGEYLVTATLNGQSARVTVRVRLVGAVTVEGAPTGAEAPPTTGVAASPGATVVYPPDGAIFPVNLSGVEVHIRRARGAQQSFRLRFSNALAELTITGRCRATQLDRAGCAAPVPASVLAPLAAASEGGPLTLRATVSEDGANASESPAVRVSWASVPLDGALYYWSTRIGENTTAIHRMDLSRVGVAPERWYQQQRDAPEINGERPCVGCHSISRDGRRMGIAYGGSDPGSFALIDVATRRAIAARLAPRAYEGPATFGTMSTLSPEGDRVITVLRGAMTLRRADASLAPIGAPLFTTGLAGDDRVTQPQWSDDGRLIAFVGFNQTLYDCNNPPCGARQRDNGDLAPYGQVYVSSVDGERIAAPTLLVPRSTAMNGREYTNHYPAFSDDSRFVVFNRVHCDAPGNNQGYAVDRTGAAANCSGYDNPGTRVMIVPTGGGAPIALNALNTAETWTNSWPRFGPTHGIFRGAALYWVAFSSKRPYGLRLAGDSTGRMPNAAPQLWIAAITLGQGDVPSGDPSAPAVWLAGQNLDPAVASGNHVPQWVRSYIPTPE